LFQVRVEKIVFKTQNFRAGSLVGSIFDMSSSESQLSPQLCEPITTRFRLVRDQKSWSQK